MTIRWATTKVMVGGLAMVALLGAGCGDDEEAASDEPAMRTVEGAYGPVEIPADPQRIMGDVMTADYLTALGYGTDRLVGVFGHQFSEAEEEHYLDEVWEAADLVDPGFLFEVNVEAVAAADPDLILVPFDQIDGNEHIEELKEIAPLLVVPTSESGDSVEARYGGSASFQDWRSTLRAYGEVLDRGDEAEAFIAESEEMLDELKDEHGDLISAITVSEAKSTPDYLVLNALSAARDAGALGTILLSELGFQSPPAQAELQPDEYGGVELSLENVHLLDGDLLFMEVREGATTYEDSPLWPTLEVVKDDGVVVVGNHWQFGGAVGARHVIEDIDAALDDLAAR